MSQRRKKIVIFDDDDDILSICTCLLEDDGWQVTAFTECSAPLEKISLAKPDVILMDNWIPGGGGILATRALKNSDKLSKIPVVYFSANNDIRLLAESAGADLFISKPFDIDELKTILKKALEISAK